MLTDWLGKPGKRVFRDRFSPSVFPILHFFFSAKFAPDAAWTEKKASLLVGIFVPEGSALDKFS